MKKEEKKTALQAILKGIAAIGVLAIILFGGAGTLAWQAAWGLLGLFVCLFVIAGAVVRSGPYRFVRHPMYLGIIILVIRTFLEDRMLASELSGYSSYAATVRYRLIPGLW